MGIGRMLVENESNEELARYLAERSYDTASLGETSADELALRTVSDASDNEIDIYKTDEISQGYEKMSQLASAVDTYEKEVVEAHLALDLYR